MKSNSGYLLFAEEMAYNPKASFARLSFVARGSIRQCFRLSLGSVELCHVVCMTSDLHCRSLAFSEGMSSRGCQGKVMRYDPCDCLYCAHRVGFVCSSVGSVVVGHAGERHGATSK